MRKQFSKSDIKQFLEAHTFARGLFTKKSQVVQDDAALFVDNKLYFLLFNDVWCPSLKLLVDNPTLLPHVVVDKGAIKFVVNGADVMRPGIVRMDSFCLGALVVIVDEGFGKPLAVGTALFSSDDMRKMDSGKVVTLLHHIGDAYWEKSI
ncbi:RNA-binding protein [Candidatus Woesearchaeota archaeon]|nr:RNA-binding protein [Candidatus Woesearchaeota archaeon]